MKAAYFEQTGPPEVIQYGELPKPTASDSQVLVKVAAVAINPIDTYVRSGAIKFDGPKPYIVGKDLAGTVEDVGSNVRRFRRGDRVWGSNQGLLGRQGTFSEFAAVEEEWLYATPASVRDEDAAAIALVGITAHLGLFRDAKIKAGETLFINGGTGGVGSTVVQMAHTVGARVVTTCGTDEKCQAARALGADLAINYKTDDVAARVKEFAPQGVNIYWETLREPNFEMIVEMLAQRGRVVLMAGREARPAFPVGPFYVKGCSLHGFVMFMATPDEQRVCADDMNYWLSTGRLRPKIDRVMKLSETAAAHRLQEEATVGKSGATAGKIVLTP